MRLDTQPTDSVTVTVNDPANTDVTAEPASLSFSASTWSTAQTVTVSAKQDDDAADDTATVTHTVSGADDDGEPSDVAVTVTDRLRVCPDHEEGGDATYTVRLDTQPTDSVTVTVKVPGHTDVTAEPASLSFSASTWSTAQTVTVSAKQDDDAADDTATVTHTVSGADYLQGR